MDMFLLNGSKCSNFFTWMGMACIDKIYTIDMNIKCMRKKKVG